MVLIFQICRIEERRGTGSATERVQSVSLLNSLVTLQHIYIHNIYTIHDNKKIDKMFICRVWRFPNCVYREGVDSPIEAINM